MKIMKSFAFAAVIAAAALTVATFAGEAQAAASLVQGLDLRALDVLGGGSGLALVGLGLKELRAKRQGHLDTARALIEKAKTENRELTPQERSTYEAECRSAESVADEIEAFLDAQQRAAGPQPGAGNQPADPAVVAREAIAAERTRASTIRQRVAAAGLPADFADGLIDRGVEVAHVADQIIDELARRGGAGTLPSGGGIRVGRSGEDPVEVRSAMIDAVVARATDRLPASHRIEMSERGRDFAHHSLLDLCADLARTRGERVPSHLRGAALYEHLVQIRALSTSDFPILLADAGNKILVKAYELANVTYRMVFARKTFNDFKAHKFNRMGDFPNLLEVGENGEFKNGTIGEAKQELTLATYGRIIGLSRRIIINDDMGAFADIPMKAGRRVADFENATAWAQLALNSSDGPTITETGRALANTTDNTKAGSAAAISVTTVGAARAAMMKKTSIDGLKLNVAPRYLVTSPDKFTDAEQFCSVNILPATDATTNPFKGRLTPVGDANLTGNGWWLFADPADLETLVYGHLAGAEGPRFQTREGFTVDGVEFKVALDFVAGAIDYRGAWRNAGA